MTTRDEPLTAPSVGWVAVGRLLLIAVFGQAILAGLLLSGATWARELHRFVAFGLLATAFAASLIAIARLREGSSGSRLAGLLVALTIGLVVQLGAGLLSAGGERLLWVHVPLGVALTGLAAGLEPAARQLGRRASTTRA